MATLPPCLYLVWPASNVLLTQTPVAEGYLLRTYRDDDTQNFLELITSDGESMNDAAWNWYRDNLLPDGLFVVESPIARLVATAGAVHNPNPGRYYFPFGGELGYLIVDQAHRGRALGKAVSIAVVRRFQQAGYKNIRVCVQEHRLPAIRTYLGVGFEPLLHSKEMEERWKLVCEKLGMTFVPERWPRTVR